MIPKVIWTTWIGTKDKPGDAYFRDDHRATFARCRTSWAKFAPNFQVVCLTPREALEGFGDDPFARQQWDRGYGLSQWAELRWLYEFGGVYLDSDYELLKPLDPFLNELCFVGHQGANRSDGNLVGTAIMGAAPFDPYVRRCLDEYKRSDFDRPNTGGPLLYTDILRRWGWDQRDRDAKVATVSVYAHDVFYPVHWTQRQTEGRGVTPRTVGTHGWACSWQKKPHNWGKR